MCTHVQSLSDFIRFARDGQPDIATFIYRAQPSKMKNSQGEESDTFLLPSIMRQQRRADLTLRETEEQMLKDFQREAPSLLSIQPTSSIEWMALAQHHGIPTRLLDWTTNPLVSLFFAVENQNSKFPSHIYRGKIYNTQVYAENGSEDTTTLDPDAGPFRFYMPSYADRRIAAQSSCFTLHPQFEFDQGEAYFHHYQEILPNELQVTRCIIPVARFGPIKAELYEIGISHKTIFPGLDGLGKSISYANTAQRDIIREPWD